MEINTARLTKEIFLMMRQVSGIADNVRHIIDYNNKELNKGHIAFITTELADLQVLIEKMCADLNINYIELMKFAWERDIDKKQDYIKRHSEKNWL